VRSKLLISALLLLLLVSALAIYQLFVLRFENGDLFPPGSSLRSDPLGSMALYLALERTAGINLRRNYRPFDHQQPTGSTILLLGIDHQRLLTASKQDSAQLEQLAGRGNRVVIAFTPANGPATAAATGAGDQKKSPGAWGVTPELLPDEPGSSPRTPLRGTLVDTTTALPQEALFHSRLTLQSPLTGWQVIYAAQDRPVLLERRFGTGSLVLVADSSIFSNQRMKEDRQPALLAWLMGANRTVIFDESHLGVTEQGGIMTLIRRFGLLPLLAVLLLLAGLYLWRASIPLAPDNGDQSSGPAVGATRDSFSGLVNLLRRAIPADQIVAACYQEWQRSFAREIKDDPVFRKELHDAINRSADPVSGYQRAARLQAERKIR